MRKFLVIATMVFGMLTASAQVNVDIQGKKGNDTLLFKGIPNSHDMSQVMQNVLRNCGWFDLVGSGSSNYILSGTGSGNSVRLELSDGAGTPLYTVTGNGATFKEASKQAVDLILNKLYKIPGICKSKIVFVAEVMPQKKEIYMCDFDGTNFKKVTSNGGLSLEPVWTPGCRSIVYSFVGRTFTSLVEHDIATGKSRKLAQFTGLNAGGRISPDGRKVALILSKDNKVDLYVRDVNGGKVKRLTRDDAVEASPCWSPDSSKICYVSDAGATRRPKLRVISVYGGAPSPLRGTVGSECVSPMWSKDGKIVYAAKIGGYTIAVQDTIGNAQKKNPMQKLGKVLEKGGNWESPSWAPDNRHVVCSQNNGLWVVDTWTGNARQIVGGKSRLSLPDWSELMN